MARYTMTIQDILMMYVWEDGKENELTTTKEIIDYAMPKLFNFSYPLYDGDLKEQFQRDFIRHFYMREIGSETLALFKQRLEDYLYLSNDKWAKVYESLSDFNPFNNYHLKTTRGTDEFENTDKTASRDDVEKTTRDLKGNEKTTSSQKSKIKSDGKEFSRTIDSDTPDERMELTASDGTGLVTYASNISEVRGTTENTSDNDTNVSRETNQNDVTKTDKSLDRDEKEKRLREFNQALEEHKSGKIGNESYTKLYKEFILGFDSINKQMFREMGYLFMGLLN